MVNRSHHGLHVWQESIDLVDAIYKCTATFPKEELYGLTSQMRRAAVSVPANIAEGGARSGKRDFKHHLIIARGSVSELETLIIIAKRLGYPKSTEEITSRAEKTFALLCGLLNSLNVSKR